MTSLANGAGTVQQSVPIKLALSHPFAWHKLERKKSRTQINQFVVEIMIVINVGASWSSEAFPIITLAVVSPRFQIVPSLEFIAGAPNLSLSAAVAAVLSIPATVYTSETRRRSVNFAVIPCMQSAA